MSCAEGGGGLKRYPGTGCCGSSCAAEKTGCLASEPRIRSCYCQENVGCLDRANCGGYRPFGTAATGACPGPCQCSEEEAWNRNGPPKPNCEWLSNFSELRRQWSDHGRQGTCKCCHCKSCRTAAPCKPCLPIIRKCSKPKISCNERQSCCNPRLSGGASANSSFRQQEECPQPMHTTNSHSPGRQTQRMSGGCSPGGCEMAHQSSCQPSSSCKPCSPSPRPILKNRSCCQCVPGQCMCQPMPRSCHCPPPIAIDARADRDCECECPSSPECACPPSERRFSRAKVKCPNARLCCPTPRPRPGPKCYCSKCQPCMPPPCDPCTSSKCQTVAPKMKPCNADSPCDDDSPCRPESPRMQTCQPIPPCNDCRKMGPKCRSPPLSGLLQGMSQFRTLNRPQSPNFRFCGSSNPCAVDKTCDNTSVQSTSESCEDQSRDISSEDNMQSSSFRICESHQPQYSSSFSTSRLKSAMQYPSLNLYLSSFLELLTCFCEFQKGVKCSCLRSFRVWFERHLLDRDLFGVPFGKVSASDDSLIRSRSSHNLKHQASIRRRKSLDSLEYSGRRVLALYIADSQFLSRNTCISNASATKDKHRKKICDDSRNVISNLDLTLDFF